jgi:hypothetical protein
MRRGPAPFATVRVGTRRIQIVEGLGLDDHALAGAITDRYQWPGQVSQSGDGPTGN